MIYIIKKTAGDPTHMYMYYILSDLFLLMMINTAFLI